MLGLARYESAPSERLRGATRRALENLVSLCIREEAKFLLIAGDLYDGDWRDYNTGLFFVRQMAKLREAGIRVFLIRGNHDAASVITRQLHLPDNVFEFPTRKADTVEIEELGVAIHGRSYGKKAVLEDLSAGYPAPVAGHLNVGLLHTCAGGRPGHENYAPCRVDALVAKGYDYWALGHVHTRETLHEAPWIVFPGNLQGRQIRETGARGCMVVTVAGGSVAGVEFCATDVLRWARCEVDLSAAESVDVALSLVRDALADELAVADGTALAVRIRLTGRTAAHAGLAREPARWQQEIHAAALDLAADDIWIEQIRFETRTPLDLDALRKRDDPVGGLLRSIQELRTGGEAGAALAPVFGELLAKLPAEAREGVGRLDLASPEALRDLLDEAEQLLVPRLLAGDGR